MLTKGIVMARGVLPRRTKRGKLSKQGRFILVKQRGREGNRYDSEGKPDSQGQYHIRRLSPRILAARIRVQKAKSKRRVPKRKSPQIPSGDIPDIPPAEETRLPQSDKPFGEASGRAGAEFATYFKAAGTFGTYDELTKTKSRKGYSPDILGEDADDYGSRYGIPAAFFSQQSLILGQVKWDGILSLDEMIAELNKKLQFRGEEIDGFDFRRAYPVWSYSYQVVEFIGIKTTIIRSESEQRGT